MNLDTQALIGTIFTSAQNAYIFNKIFQENNGGKVFDLEAWAKDVEKIVSDPMFTISPDKQKELETICNNLDEYAVVAEEITKNKPELKLI